MELRTIKDRLGGLDTGERIQRSEDEIQAGMRRGAGLLGFLNFSGHWDRVDRGLDSELRFKILRLGMKHPLPESSKGQGRSPALEVEEDYPDEHEDDPPRQGDGVQGQQTGICPGRFRRGDRGKEEIE